MIKIKHLKVIKVLSICLFMFHIIMKINLIWYGNGGAENDELTNNFGSDVSGVANSSITFENNGNYEQISNQ